MGGKIFFVLYAFAILSPVCPSTLTKEITAEQSSALKFRDILARLEKTDILEELITLTLGNFEDTYLNLTNLFQSQRRPDISNMLDTLNLGLGARLLYVNDDYIQIDPGAIEKLLLDKVSSIIPSVVPRDNFQQLAVYETLQQQIQDTVEELRLDIDNRKISLKDINIRAASGHVEARDYLLAIQTSVCNTLVASGYSDLNDTLTELTDFLNNIPIGSSNNTFLSTLISLEAFVINFLKTAITYVWELAESIQSSICTFLLSSRKRRDLTIFQETLDRSKRDTALTEAVSQALGVRSITVIISVIWNVLATIISYALVSLFASAFLNQVCPSPLTKEITADQSPALKFRDIVFKIKTTDPAEFFRTIFGNFETIFLNIAELLQSQSNPDISEILDIFNSGLGARLLVLNEDNVQVDPSGVERLLSDKVRSIVKSTFSKDPFLQLMVNEFLQNEIQRTGQKIRPELDARKVPLEKLTFVAVDQPIATKAINVTDIFSTVIALFQTSLCNNIITPIYSRLTTVLTTFTTILDSLALTSDNVLLSILASLLSVGVDVAKEVINYIQQLAEAFTSAICSTSSRRRRDVSYFQDPSDIFKRNAALGQVGARAVSLRGGNVIVAVLAGLVAAALTYAVVYALTGGIWSILSLISNFLFGSIKSWFSNIFSSIFSWAF